MNKHGISIITSNPGKMEEFQQLIGHHLQITFHNIDLPELQGEPEAIAKAKAIFAYRQLQKPILIDDGSLCFNAYKGLPGPYIKWFLKKMSNQDIARMVEPFPDKTGYAICILAYMDAQIQAPLLFVGRIDGTIVPPRGEESLGWYNIFQPKGQAKTLAEMPEQERNKHTHRYFACQELMKHIGRSDQGINMG